MRRCCCCRRLTSSPGNIAHHNYFDRPPTWPAAGAAVALSLTLLTKYIYYDRRNCHLFGHHHPTFAYCLAGWGTVRRPAHQLRPFSPALTVWRSGRQDHRTIITSRHRRHRPSSSSIAVRAPSRVDHPSKVGRRHRLCWAISHIRRSSSSHLPSSHWVCRLHLFSGVVFRVLLRVIIVVRSSGLDSWQHRRSRDIRRHVADIYTTTIYGQ